MNKKNANEYKKIDKQMKKLHLQYEKICKRIKKLNEKFFENGS